MVSKKAKKEGSSINSRLQLVIKSGKYNLGYRETIRQLRQGKNTTFTTCINRLYSGKAKLVILADNTPQLRRSEIEYYAMLAKTGVHHYKGDNIELGTACGELIDFTESEINRIWDGSFVGLILNKFR